MENTENDDKPWLLKAVELVVASPENIKKDVDSIVEATKEKYGINFDPDKVADKIINNYAYHAGYAGAGTALSSIVPGLGTIIAGVGGAAADVVLSMKYQIEMTMSIAYLYGNDISVEDEKRICFMVAGIGAINKASQQAAQNLGVNAATRLTKQYLKGATLTFVKQLFKAIGLKFTQKGFIKILPFGIGTAAGFFINKGMTSYVGSQAKVFYKI